MNFPLAVTRTFVIALTLVTPSTPAECAPDDGASFGSDQEFQNYLKKKKKPRPPAHPRHSSFADEAAPAEPAPTPAAEPSVASTPAGAAAESITNNQHAGVDEGGIVKTYGDYLVVLRRGRLFTVRVGQSALMPV